MASYYMNNPDNQVEITEVFEINETHVPSSSMSMDMYDSDIHQLPPSVIAEVYDENLS